MKTKIIKCSTVAISLDILLKGQLRFLNSYFDIIALSGKDVHLENVAYREQTQVIDLKMIRSISLLRDAISLFKLYIKFRKEKPEIVHSITPKAGLLSMVAAKFARVPIRMHTYTGLIFPTSNGFKRVLLVLMDKILCACATNIYPEGEGVKMDLLKFKITKKPLKILANGSVNGIDVEYYSSLAVSIDKKENLKRELRVVKEDFVFVFVGRLVGDKGINELIAAFEKICYSKSKCKLVLVGPIESELDPLNEATISIIEKNINIISVGFQNDVRPFLAIADVLVFPSYREGFPNVVMQAGAMELPAIVTNINGCNEIIVEGKNGTIIPSKNVQKLEMAMFKMIDNQEYRLSLKENARPMICNRYEQQVVWEALLKEYQTLIQNLPNRAN